MSTRAVYGFYDIETPKTIYWVYVHHDGCPTGAAEKFSKVLNSNLAWPLPRYEADEFAAAFVAANKTYEGGVRLSLGPEGHGDIEFVYVVHQDEHSELWVKTSEAGRVPAFYDGPLDTFIATASTLEPA